MADPNDPAALQAEIATLKTQLQDLQAAQAALAKEKQDVATAHAVSENKLHTAIGELQDTLTKMRESVVKKDEALNEQIAQTGIMAAKAADFQAQVNQLPQLKEKIASLERLLAASAAEIATLTGELTAAAAETERFRKLAETLYPKRSNNNNGNNTNGAVPASQSILPLLINDDERDRQTICRLAKSFNLTNPTKREVKDITTGIRTLIDGVMTGYKTKPNGPKYTELTMTSASHIHDATDFMPPKPDPKEKNINLTPEELGIRYSHVDEAQLVEFNRHIRMLGERDRAMGLTDLTARNQLVGNITNSMSVLTKGLNLDPSTVPVVMICGWESAGKTLLLDALMTAHVGYSGPDRSTRCPVHYLYTYNPDASPPRCWIDTTAEGMASAKTRPGQSQEEVAAAVKQHMLAIERDIQLGATTDPLYVQIESAIVQNAGLIIDMPGVPQSAKPGKQDQEYRAAIFKMIRDKLAELDPDYAFAICVEDASRRRADGYFHVEALGGVSRDRFEVIFTKADGHYAIQPTDPAKPWRHTISCPIDVKLDDVRTIYNDMRNDSKDEFAPILSLLGVRQLGQAFEGKLLNADEYRSELVALLDSNYHQMVAAYDEFAKVRQFDGQSKFNARLLFDFKRTGLYLMERRNRGTVAACCAVEGELDALRRVGISKLDDFGAATMVESSNIRMVLNLAFRCFCAEWQTSVKGDGSLTVPEFNHNYDNNLPIHKDFPLKLSYKIRDLASTLEKGTLEQRLAPHGLRLRAATGCDQEAITTDIEQLLTTHIDGHNETCVNLGAAYQRCASRLLMRLAAITMDNIDRGDILRAAGVSHHTLNVQSHDMAKGVNVLVTRCITLFYDQALQYVREVLIAFFSGAVDTVLANTWLANRGTSPLFGQDRGLGLWRHQLLKGVEVFVDSELDVLRRNIVRVVSLRHDHREGHGTEHNQRADHHVESQVDEGNHTDFAGKMINTNVDLFSKTAPKSNITHPPSLSTVEGALTDPLDFARKEARRLFNRMHRQSLKELSRTLEDHIGTLMEESQGNRGLLNVLERFTCHLVARVEYKAADAALLNTTTSETTVVAHVAVPISEDVLDSRLRKYYQLTSRAEFNDKMKGVLRNLVALGTS